MHCYYSTIHLVANILLVRSAGPTAEREHPYTDWYIERNNEGEGKSVPILQ